MWQNPLRSAAFLEALTDVYSGVQRYHLWGLLGYQDIKQRYRRSILGPFWLTMSTAIMVCSMGFLYALLFKMDVHKYLPYLTVGMIVWGFFSTLISEGCTVFISSEAFIKQIKLPLFAHVARMIWKNFLIFMHNFVILIVVIWWGDVNIGWGTVISLFGMLLALANGAWVSLLLGMISARYRDIPPVVNSLVQIVFFLTPIMWRADALGDRQWIAYMNPIYHVLECIRRPLLGEGVNISNFIVAGLLCLVGWVFTVLFYARFSKRVPYWV
jgi:ABC-type polysaccharide/polyol phosphate export permease